jgi:glycerophosphoryl diester phosphodiesterase
MQDRRQASPAQAVRPGLPERGVAAHRGGGTHRPENTLAAFREAVRLGAHQIEFDVRRSRDGELVVIHDARVDRTSDGRGAVAELALAELRRLDFGRHRGEAFAGERIPTLREVFRALPRDVWINVQIKQGEPIGAEVAALVAEEGRREQAFLSAADSALAAARARVPGIRVCPLARQSTRDAYVEHAIALGADFIQFHHARGDPEPEQVERCRAAGIRVNFFGDPRGERLAELFGAGVDFVLVDDLPRALDSVRRLGIAPLWRGPLARVEPSCSGS